MIKLEKIVMLQELKREGLSVSVIARRTGMDRKTVHKRLDRGLKALAWSVAEPPARPFCIEVLQSMSLPPCPAPITTGWSVSCRAGFAPAR